MPLARAVPRAVYSHPSLRIPVGLPPRLVIGPHALGAEMPLALLALLALLVRPATAFPDGTVPRRYGGAPPTRLQSAPFPGGGSSSTWIVEPCDAGGYMPCERWGKMNSSGIDAATANL